MQQSVLLCISTILDSGNHYSKMMEMTDAFGSKIFETIQITLVCGTTRATHAPINLTLTPTPYSQQTNVSRRTRQKNAGTSSRPCRGGSAPKRWKQSGLSWQVRLPSLPSHIIAQP